MAITLDDQREMYDSTFARLFGPENPNWHTNALHNETFLKVQENWMNDRLAAKGYLFLNDLYDALGFPRVPHGQLIGWFRDEGRKVILRMTVNDDGSVMIEPNVTNSDVMYHKI